MTRFPHNRYAIFGLLVVGGCLLDLWTKSWVFSWTGMESGEVYWLWQGHVGIQRSLNNGALFGMGQGLVWLFAAISVVAAIAIPVWLFRFGVARDLWLTIALAGVMAGILGNLYDRLGLHQLEWPAGHPRAGEHVYAVRDWILWQWNDQLRWPNFNLADSFLVIGAGILLCHSLWSPPSSAEAQRKDDVASPRDAAQRHLAAPKRS
jgi:signal peptidase II